MITDRERILMGAVDKLKDAIAALLRGIDNKEIQEGIDKAIPLTQEANGLVSAFNELHSSDRFLDKPESEEKVISSDNFKNHETQKKN